MRTEAQQAYSRDYYAANREARLAYANAYNAAHRSQKRAYTAAYDAANNRAAAKKRQEVRKNREVDQRDPTMDHPLGLSVMKVLEENRKLYQVCCGEPFHLDHIISLADGGPHATWNLTPIPARLNQSKRRAVRKGVPVFIDCKGLSSPPLRGPHTQAPGLSDSPDLKPDRTIL